MNRATRTLNPLHFEDLEPHRFEDLIRQLAYSFRPWRHLEATGRLGNDKGVDIRGVEVASLRPELDFDAGGEEGQAVEPTGAAVTDEREWRIQCKRHKELGPKLVREVVGEAIPSPADAPYGLIVAVSCNVSADTLAAFHEERISRGVVEGHLWSKAHLEDRLFLPENDHLLFAYFGLSLRVRTRSQLQRLRDRLAIKRKLLRALDGTSANRTYDVAMLIRDFDEERYPFQEQVPDFASRRFPPWHLVIAEGLGIDALQVWRHSLSGWVKPDGTWDVMEQSSEEPTHMEGCWTERRRAPWTAEDMERHRRVSDSYSQVPERERRSVLEVSVLPYDHIVEVDPIGDALYAGPHLFCRFDEEKGPYDGRVILVALVRGDRRPLDVDGRRPLFAELLPEDSQIGETPRSEEASDS
jgi:hypothetical protein